jgi:spermidine synthase
MAAELTAVRLLAPRFGDSAYVWTNVIGVILAALAIGAWLGGRLARGPGVRARASAACLLAGVWLAAAPVLVRAIGPVLAPAEMPLEAAMPALVRGSFVATAVLFAPAMLALGAVTPLLITGAVRGGREVGQAAGAIGAAETVGCLVGTFAATHVLVPELGSRAAMGIAGAVLLLASLVVWTGSRGRTGAAAAAMLAFALGAGHGPIRAVDPPAELLAEVEGAAQFLQVLREPDPGGDRIVLRINEGLDSYHSLAVVGSAFTGGAYYDWHAVVPLLVKPSVQAAALRALSIGDGAGSMRAVYGRVHPGAVVDAVDIDGSAMELGDRWFPGPKAAGDRFVIDGRVFLEQARRRWHVIHVDAYAHQVYVPAHLASREFFTVARERLHDGGLIACNVGALHKGDPVLRAIGATMAEVFGHALALLLPRTRNALLIAARGDAPVPAAMPRVVPAGLSVADQKHWAAVLDQAIAGPWHDLAGAGPLLDDDRPRLDRLFADSYVARSDPGVVVPTEGDTPPAGAESAAHAAAVRRAWPEVLQAVQQSREATAYLREVAGDAQWSLRALRSAAAEYAAALALATTAGDAVAATRLRGKLDDLAADLRPIAVAEAAARRNGAWQWGIIAAAAVALVLAMAWRR